MSLDPLLRISTLGVDGDPDVGDGVHVSVSLNPALGWPLHPFACGIAEDGEVSDIAADYFDRDGDWIAPPFELDDKGPVDVLLHGIGAVDDPPWCWVRVFVDGDDAVVDALDPIAEGRPFARRTAEPYSFGASSIRRLRLSGHGRVRGVMGVSAAHVGRRISWFAPFGLPIDDDAAWYAGGHGEQAALDRVARAAPRRLGPPDDPGLSGVPLSPADEVDRVVGLRDSVLPWIHQAFYGSTAPDQAVLSFETPAHGRVVAHADPVPRTTRSAMPCVPALTVQAADPGLARYLGLATTLPVAPPDGERPLLVLVGAYFAVHRTRRVGPWRLADLIPESHLEGPLADGIDVDLSALRERLGRARDIRLVPLVSGVGATPDRPQAPDLATSPGRWMPGQPESWHQKILLHGAPPPGPVALARLAPDAARSLHRVSGSRAVVLLAGREAGPSTLADVAVPVGPGGASWQVAQADRFGRWSDPASVSGPLPPRPLPVRPVVRCHVLTADLDPRDTAPRSPASLRVAIAVPGRETLAAGALALSTVEITVDGVVSTHTAVGVVTHLAPVSPTSPAQSVNVGVSAVFVDDQGGRSAPAATEVTVHDPRPLPVVPTGPALLWSGRQDPTGGSELALTWPATSPDARYRVYLSGSERLAALLGVDTGGPRCSLACRIWELRATLTDRAAFSLITDQPLAPVGGVVSLRHILPGALRGVVFVRVVPVSKGNVEAAFAHCGLVPVAVPHGEAPPPPTVRAHADPNGEVTITVEATGLSARWLSTNPPEARIRRARHPSDPFYAPVVAASPLAESHPGVWTATLTDTPPGLLPYHQVTYWSEVRYPAELALPDGVTPVPVDGAITTPPGVPLGDVPSLWSPPSLPTTAMPVPAVIPDISGALTYTAEAANHVISGALPADHVIQLWARTPSGLTEIDTTEASPTFNYTVPAGTTTGYYAQLTDPLGRSGPLTEVEPQAG